MRISLVISSMGYGGAERVMSILASGWVEQGHEVTLLRLDNAEKPAYPIHNSVKQRALGLLAESGNSLEAFTRNLRRVAKLRHAIRESEPDIVISFVDRTNILTLLATRLMHVPVIVSERIDPSRDDIRGIWRALRRISYPMADMVVCQTIPALRRFHQRVRMKGCVIPNPVTLDPCPNEQDSPKSRPNGYMAIAMGRLVYQKGFDLLLDAFAQVANQHSDWSLQIVGEGPLKRQLEMQAMELGLSTRVFFAGAIQNPSWFLRNADLFVLSSRFEGFPNALCEAMACSLPVASFDCPSGPADIIRDGIDGVLVAPEDVNALALALDRLMGNAKERKSLADRAPEIVERFGTDKILLLWKQLFDDLSLAKN